MVQRLRCRPRAWDIIGSPTLQAAVPAQQSVALWCQSAPVSAPVGRKQPTQSIGLHQAGGQPPLISERSEISVCRPLPLHEYLSNVNDPLRTDLSLERTPTFP